MSRWVKTLDAMVEHSIHPLTRVVLTSHSQKRTDPKVRANINVERRDREGGAKPPLPAQL